MVEEQRYDHGVPVVIDNGSSTCKAGFSGDDTPKVVVPTSIIGRSQPSDENDKLLSHPIQNGVITDWDAMENACTLYLL